MNYSIRTMTKDELNIALDLAKDEGWNPGLYDRDCFYELDPHGFFIGLADNKPVSCISAVKYSSSFGFLGLYIVKKEFRGKGYGKQLWNEALRYLGDRNIGLDGVVAQQENYKKSGFKFAYNTGRYEFRRPHPLFEDAAQRAVSVIVPVSSITLEQLNAYDRQFVPAERKVFLSCWIKQPESITLVSMSKNLIHGYGMIRKCHKGYKIGPLFALDFEVADNLFQSLVSSISGNLPVFLDIPQINLAAIKLVTKYKMKKVFSAARMYTKKPPILPIEKIFGVTTFEIG